MKRLAYFELIHKGGYKVLPDDSDDQVDLEIVQRKFFLLQNRQDRRKNLDD